MKAITYKDDLGQQFEVGRQQVFESEAVDGVSVPAAHLHQAVMTAWIDEAADLLGARPGDRERLLDRVAVGVRAVGGQRVPERQAAGAP